MDSLLQSLGFARDFLLILLLLVILGNSSSGFHINSCARRHLYSVGRVLFLYRFYRHYHFYIQECCHYCCYQDDHSYYLSDYHCYYHCC